MMIPRLLLMTLLLGWGHDARADSAVVGGRPFHFHVPASFDGITPIPLVVVLHGIQITGVYQQLYFGMTQLSEDRNFILVYPHGTRNAAGQQFWNGTSCCDTEVLTPVDDVTYLDQIITFMKGRFPIDAHKVFLMGHSNGAFLANKYACSLWPAPQITGMVTVSGAQYPEPGSCGSLLPGVPAFAGWGKIAVLHVHGTLDELVQYYFSLPSPYPPALQTVANWAYRNGCFSGSTTSSADLMQPTGNETSRQHYEGCTGAPFEFWTVNGADHVPNFYPPPDPRAFGGQAYDWLLANPGR